MIAKMHQILNYKNMFLGSLLVLFGWFGNIYLEQRGVIGEASSIPVREDSTEYKYINPFLFLDNAEEDFPELDPLKNQVSKYIDEAMEKGEAEKTSFYFRDMNTSKWTGVNEDELYAPASMLKVAIMVVYLKLAKDDPSILNQKFYYKQEDYPGQFYKSKTFPDGLYSASDLIKQMIVNSDNVIAPLLVKGHSNEILDFYKHLRLPETAKLGEDFLSAKLYSRIFRVLYNGTYLPRSISEQALQLLTYTNFDKGLRQGVPEDVVIAHKFGESGLYKDGAWNYHELHDCGIVYLHKKPYFICIMTKGSDFKNLEKIIGDISKITFEYQKE